MNCLPTTHYLPEMTAEHSTLIREMALTPACQLEGRVHQEKELVGMGDPVEPANLGVEVTAQQEVGSDLGGTRQLVRQSKKRVSHFCTRKLSSNPQYDRDDDKIMTLARHDKGYKGVQAFQACYRD